MNKKQKQNEVISRKMLTDRVFRKEITKKNHYWFFHTYFSHYITAPTADFQKEIFELTESSKIQMAAIIAFRGSGKSTIVNLSFPLWSIIGIKKKRFILIVGQTQSQARQHLKNIRKELESNPILKKDFGSFEEEGDEMNAYSLYFKEFDARIVAVSMEQSVRGIRHGQYRPDLIICDDIEDMASTKTREGRNKTYNWLTGEVIPAGAKDMQLYVIGNLLHEDCTLKRLEARINDDQMDGVFRMYPIVDENEKSLWPGMYKNKQELLAKKRTIGNEIAWQREFMLQIIPDEDQVVHRDWIKYYDELPGNKVDDSKFRYIATGIDLAISLKSSADYTAMVSFKVYGYGKKLKLFVLPQMINKRLTSPQTIEQIKSLHASYGKDNTTKFYIESVAYQTAIIDLLKQENVPAEEARLNGQDKRSRIASIAHLIQDGRISFPKQGAELLINQLVNFGVEKHDDLADAFTLAVHKLIHEPAPKKFSCHIIEAPRRRHHSIESALDEIGYF
jgi:predicted phage terminase large subunit-like protein